MKTRALKTTVFDLYDTATFTLWVEDDLTGVFLTDFWRDTSIRILNAGNKEGVKNLVQGAPLWLRGKTVVGFVDLDFDDAHCEWDNASRHVVTTEVHEFENYLLDFDLLGAIAKDSPATIKATAKTYAENALYWMACKHVLRDLRRTQYSDFPADPKLYNESGAVLTEQQAVDHIWKNQYWKNVQQGVRNFSENYFKTIFTNRAQAYKQDLDSSDDKWTETFSGKEIFRHIRSKTPGLARFGSGDLTQAQADEKLARKMAEKLRTPQFEQHPLRLNFDAWKVALKKRIQAPAPSPSSF